MKEKRGVLQCAPGNHAFIRRLPHTQSQTAIVRCSPTTRIRAQQGTYLARHHRYPLWSIGVQQESISLLARAWRCLHHTPVHSPGSRMTTNLAQCPHKVQTAALAYVAGAFKCGMAKTGMLQRTSCTWQNVPKDRTTGTMCRLTKDFPPTTLRR